MDFHPLADIFPMMSDVEFAALKLDIKSNGLREPVWTYEGKIIDGRNRFKACAEIGVEPSFRAWNGEGSPVAFVVSLNLHRRHLDESQRAMVAARLANLSNGLRADRSFANLQSLPPVTQAEAAKLLNVSPRSVATAVKVKEQAAPELVKAVETGKASVSAAAEISELPEPEQRKIAALSPAEIKRAAKQLAEDRAQENARQRAETRAKAAPLPTGKYSTIVIDPPWPMEKIQRDVRPNQVGFDYPTLSEAEIDVLPVGNLAADNCHLFVWATQKFLPQAMRHVEGWGFRYVCLFVWRKSGGPQPYGLPQYNCEFVIYARRGSPSFVDTKAFNCCFDGPRREHSRKPDEFFETVARVTDGARLEMFARAEREGWTSWGNEVGKFKEVARG